MLPEQTRSPSYLTRIRGVPLLPQEWVKHSFTPADGISQEPSATGRLLVTTNQRIISFSQGQKGDETVLVPVDELNGVVVKPEARSSGSLLQGLLLLVAGGLIYLISGYWLADRLQGPNIPIINLDVWALVILGALIWGGWLIGHHYFARGTRSGDLSGRELGLQLSLYRRKAHGGGAPGYSLHLRFPDRPRFLEPSRRPRARATPLTPVI